MNHLNAFEKAQLDYEKHINKYKAKREQDISNKIGSKFILILGVSFLTVIIILTKQLWS